MQAGINDRLNAEVWLFMRANQFDLSEKGEVLDSGKSFEYVKNWSNSSVRFRIRTSVRIRTS